MPAQRRGAACRMVAYAPRLRGMRAVAHPTLRDSGRPLIPSSPPPLPSPFSAPLFPPRRWDFSLRMKRDDPDANREFGWVLEMWGYTLGALSLGIRHVVDPDFQARAAREVAPVRVGVPESPGRVPESPGRVPESPGRVPDPMLRCCGGQRSRSPRLAGRRRWRAPSAAHRAHRRPRRPRLRRPRRRSSMLCCAVPCGARVCVCVCVCVCVLRGAVRAAGHRDGRHVALPDLPLHL